MEIVVSSLFVLWFLVVVILFGVFFINLQKLMKLLEGRYREKWLYLTTPERFKSLPRGIVWKKCWQFLKDPDDMDDSEILGLKKTARAALNYCQIIFIVGLPVFFLLVIVLVVVSASRQG